MIDSARERLRNATTTPRRTHNSRSSSSSSWLVPLFLLLLWMGQTSVQALEFLNPLDTSTSKSMTVKDDAPDCSNVSKTSHRLECWLWRLAIQIPEQSFRKDFVTVSISDMICTQFSIGAVDTEYEKQKKEQEDVDSSKPASSTTPTLSLNVTGISATCTGRYHASGGLEGNVEASVEGGTDGVQLVMQLVNQDYHEGGGGGVPMPYELHTTHCASQLQVPRHGIHFSGSMSARFIDLFSLSIAHWISDALQGQICPLAQQQLDPMLTMYIQKVDDWLEQYLPHNEESESMDMDSNRIPAIMYIDKTIQAVEKSRQRLRRLGGQEVEEALSSSMDDTTVATSNSSDPTSFPVIQSILSWGNAFLRNHLNHGFLGNWLPAPCDQADCFDLFRGITGIIHKYTHGRIYFPAPALLKNITFELALGATVSLSFQDVVWHGLDAMSTFQFLNPVTTLESPGWNVSAHVHLRVDTLPGKSSFHSDPLEESFQLILNLTKIQAIASTLLEVQQWDQLDMFQVVEAIQDIALGNNRTENIACLVHSIRTLRIPDFLVDVLVSSVSIINHQQDSLEDDLDDLVNTVLKLTLTEYPVLVTSVIQGLVNGPAKQALNDFLERLLEQWGGNEVCRPLTPSSHPHWVNFTNVKFLETVNHFLNHKHAMETMNEYLDCFSRVLVHHQTLSSSSSSSSEEKMSLLSGNNPDEELSLHIRKLELSHFDSLEEIKLFSPSLNDSSYLETSVNWGSTSLPRADISLEISYPAFDLHAVINATAFLGLVDLVVGTRIDYNLNQLGNITVAELLEHGQCALAPATELRLAQTSHFDVGRIGVNVSAVVAGGAFDDITIDASTDSYPVVQEWFTSMLDWSWGSVRQVSNKAAEKLVTQSSNLCQGVIPPAQPEPSSQPVGSTFLYVMGFLFVVGQVAVVFLAKSKGGDEEEDANLDFDSAQEVTDSLLEDSYLRDEPCISQRYEMFPNTSLDEKQTDMDHQLIDDIFEELNEGILEDQEQHMDPSEPTKSLLRDTKVPEWIRHVIPMVIVGAMLLLLSSNLSTGASVGLVVSLGGESQVKLPALFAFSLGNTVREMYSAGIYPLLFLVVVFSGIWPYAKLLIMLYAWVMPPKSPHRRERLLLTLDSLGKFSLVDTYVLVVMIVAFRYSLDLGAGGVALDVYVTPEYGFYGFLGATCLSLVVGHVMVFFHRQSQTRLSGTSAARESLFEHAFDVEDNGPRRPLSRLFQVFLFTCSLTAAVLLIIGFDKKSFIFEIGGLVGLALRENRRTAYSLLSLGASLPDSVEDSTSAGIIFLQVAYFFYAVVTPISCLLLLILLLVCPMTLSAQRSVLVAAEISNAWSAIEVFVLSIIAALFQISTFASFIIGSRCDMINQLLHELFVEALQGDDVCYTVEAYVDHNCWYLVAGVLLNSFVVSVVLRFAHCAMDERIARSQTIQGQTPQHPAANELVVDATLSQRIFRLPIGCMVFGRDSSLSSTAVEGGEEEEEEEEELPEWRNWF